jgi:hypothetical protein
MPVGKAKSRAQQQAFAIAEHHPEKSFHPELTKLKRSSLHNFAATKHKGLPKRKGKKGHKRGSK